MTPGTIEKNIDSGKTFYGTSDNIAQIDTGFKADTQENRQQHVQRMRLSDKDLVKKLLTSNQKIWLLVINF